MSSASTRNLSQQNANFDLLLIDTPGHADFGGEVERILSMVDGVALIVGRTLSLSLVDSFIQGTFLSPGRSC